MAVAFFRPAGSARLIDHGSDLHYSLNHIGQHLGSPAGNQYTCKDCCPTMELKCILDEMASVGARKTAVKCDGSRIGGRAREGASIRHMHDDERSVALCNETMTRES